MRLQILDDVYNLRTLLVTSLSAAGFEVDEGHAGDLLLRAADRRAIKRHVRDLLAQRSVDIYPVQCGNVQLDATSQEVRVSGRRLDLKRRETALLRILLGAAGQTVQRVFLESTLYADGRSVTPNALEASVSRLRRRLSNAAASVRVETRRGIGYRLVAISRAR
ncbi:MAG: winged helix-turn-helix transcriptional regulator [Sphingomonadales bacterium]|nr:winged helix-turn-helix transcriptional regulator [Sphingomonadales bacterium]MDE2570768.1 winged helix-turn-helix transcriptional regulator [Sphingomonadales bacterium]